MKKAMIISRVKIRLYDSYGNVVGVIKAPTLKLALTNSDMLADGHWQKAVITDSDGRIRAISRRSTYA